MYRKKTGFIFAGMLLVIQLVSVYLAHSIQGDSLPVSFENCLRFCFLYRDPLSSDFMEISILFRITYFSMLLLIFLLLTSALSGVSRRCRAMHLLRFGGKSAFFRTVYQKTGILSLIALVVSAVWLFLCCLLFCGAALSPSMQVVLLFLLQYLRLFVFFNLCVALFVFFLFKFGDTLSIALVLLIICLLLNADTAILPVSVLVWGNLSASLGGLFLLAIAYCCIVFLIQWQLKKTDML